MYTSMTRDPRPQGGALIVVSDCPRPSTQTPSYTIRRASDQMYLSASGRWNNAVEQIPVQDGQFDGNKFYIPFPTSLLLALDNLDRHMFTFDGSDPLPLDLPEVLPTGYFPEGTGGVGGMSQQATPLQPQSEPPVPEEPQLKVSQEPELLEMERQEVKEPPNTRVPDPSGDEPKSGSKAGLIVGLVLVALLAGAAVWYFVLRDKGAETPAPQTETQAPAPDPAPAPAPTPAPEAKKIPFMTQAREHLRQSADPAQSLELAKPMRTMDADADTSDGAFLLIEDAAQKGLPEAMFLLAQFYDPTTTLPRGTIEPNVEQAIDWYKKAGQANIAEAAPALDNLKTHVQAKAQSGDAEAARLLERF